MDCKAKCMGAPSKYNLKCKSFAISFQIVNVSRLVGVDNPVELIYFVEDQDGERLSALKCSDLMNRVDIQRAAIILGYRIEGSVAQRKPCPIHTDASKGKQEGCLQLWRLWHYTVPTFAVFCSWNAAAVTLLRKSVLADLQ